MLDAWLHEYPLRLAAACVCGCILGLEREAHGRAAGLRTIVLVCVAATAAMMLSESLTHDVIQSAGSTTWRPDPARLAAGVLTGIGFIGAGTIIRHGHVVRGVTTASVIWLAAIVGLCCGSGSILLGFATTAMGMIALSVLPYIEGIADNDWYADVEASFAGIQPPMEDIYTVFETLSIKAKGVSVTHRHAEDTCNLRISIKIKRSRVDSTRSELMRLMNAMPRIRSLAWHS